MRFTVALVLLVLAAVVMVSFVSPESVLQGAGEHWFPREVGRGGEEVDRLFDEIQWIAAGLLALTLGLLAWTVWRGAKRRSDEGSATDGSHALELAWTVAPIAVLGFLTWSQIVARAEIAGLVQDVADAPPALVIEVEGAQFDWRFRYAGPDQTFGTMDDVVEVVDLSVPIGRNVELRMRSVDVIHSFFVPALRQKRDVVPGTVTPLRFQIDAEDLQRAMSPRSLEIKCAELCGWGHYAMVGRLVPLAPERFDAWLAAREAERFTDGEPPETDEDTTSDED